MCGFEDATPKVFCNLPEEEEDNEEYVAPRRGGIIDVLDFGEECAGALKVRVRHQSLAAWLNISYDFRCL